MSNQIVESTVPEGGGWPAVERFSIDAEALGEAAARERLLDRAMGPKRRRKSSEKLRRGQEPAEGLAFVARSPDGTLIGTVRLWNIVLGAGGPAALLLGPLAVEPALKGQGIGAALMQHVVEEAARRGHRAILLVGDEPYYSRFGFSAAKTGRLSMPGPYEKERFLARELIAGALDGTCGMLRPARPALAISRARAA